MFALVVVSQKAQHRLLAAAGPVLQRSYPFERFLVLGERSVRTVFLRILFRVFSLISPELDGSE